MLFADINADMFSDIITVDSTRKTLIVHIFDPLTSNYTQKVSFKPTDCQTITNVALGRSISTLRLFVTCVDINKKTILKLYDRNMNDEIKVMTNAEVHEQFPETVDKTNSSSNGAGGSGAGGNGSGGGGSGSGDSANKGLGDEMIVAKVTKEGTVIDTAIPPK